MCFGFIKKNLKIKIKFFKKKTTPYKAQFFRFLEFNSNKVTYTCIKYISYIYNVSLLEDTHIKSF